MTGWLLDTNILSELRRPKPERKVVAFIASQPLDLLHVSSATFAETRFGIEIVPDPSRRAGLNDWLTHKVRPMFEQRVLAITEDVMFRGRLMVEDGRKADAALIASGPNQSYPSRQISRASTNQRGRPRSSGQPP